MASDKILKVKEAQVAELAEEIKNAQTIVLAEYLGLTVAQDTELRSKLREAGVNYRVVKNNIGKRAVEEAGLPELADAFVGPTAIAYSDDVVAPAKVLNDFSKAVELYSLKAGASDGAVLSLSELSALANVPAVEELHARLARGIAWPFTRLAMLSKALSEKITEQGAETAADVVEGKADTADADVEEKVEATEEKVEAEATEKNVEAEAETTEEAAEATEENNEEKESADAEETAEDSAE